MAAPIVFVSHLRLREGKLEGFKQFYQEGARLIEAGKPGTVVFLAYVNEDGTEVSIVHVFPDAHSMEIHMQGAGDRAKQAYEFLEPVSFEIYGNPTDEVLQSFRLIDPGTALALKPRPIGGYIRLAASRY